ncbi:MAG: PEP/pyruvate-binding domain-containing protein [Candidatus Lokiarchaeota archaeon]|nr:PEP/pyruvate-binding domain-containing protein [Candidatus Harpocratesius repetitus]
MDSWFVDFKKAQDLMEKLKESNYQFEEQNLEKNAELKTEQNLQQEQQQNLQQEQQQNLQQGIEYIQEQENEIKIKIELLKNKLIRKVLPDDDRMRILAVNYLSLRNLIKIGKRMIGTGQIGGKASGFLIARAIIRKNKPEMKERLEQHDSFFIGSHFFYTFLILNDCWEDRKRLTNKDTFLQGLQDIQRKILNGKFERYIIRQFREMLNYFGQSPIVVRSSSLQEDAFGNSFSGKYETIFCPNQGTPEQRLENFISAIKRIYASAVSREALLYRQDRNLLVKDEEMALLVQRVSGIDYGQYFLPHIAGVGFSYNPFVWDEKIDPNSGFLRLVFGLGTRAVDRTGDDYTCLVALNAPNLRISKDLSEIRKYSQYYIDVLNLKTNKLESIPYHRFFHMNLDIPINLFVTADPGAERRAQQLGLKHSFTSILTLTPILNNSKVLQDLGDILSELQKAYSFPVDIEFTINFRSFEEYTIHLLQCRPFQVTQETKGIKTPENIEQSYIVIKFKGPVIGTSRKVFVDRLIYISPHDYSELSIQEKYLIARIIGNINLNYCSHSQNIMLIGPGRWGTSSPNLGVPITYEEINKISIIGEIAEMHDHLIPDISLGTHFFNNIVENNLLYFADKGEYYQNLELLKDEPNKLLFFNSQ